MRFARLALACSVGSLLAASLAAQTSITGAGATFPAPIYEKWFDVYSKRTGVQINYQSIGSGGGIRQYTEGTVDFGATDGPMNDEQIAAVHGNVMHVPTVLGAVVITYNLPAVGQTKLRLDGPTIADIFDGNITKWSDKHLRQLNPGVKLPDSDIIVAHRSDGSGTSYIFSDYLSKVSRDWEGRVGKGTSLNWPVGLGGKGNDGVTQVVKQTEEAIGYVELIYALSNNLAYATVKNRTGNFIDASLASVSEAASSAKFSKDTDFRVSITDAPGPQAYPISSFTWLLVRPDSKDEAKAGSIKQFLAWMITPEAQAMAQELKYAELPKVVVGLLKPRLETLKANGKALASQ